MKRKIALLCAAALLTGCATSESIPSADVSESTSASITTVSEETCEPPAAAPSSEATEPEAETAEPEPVVKKECEYAEFFREDKVHELNIEIDSAQWSAMLASPQDKTTRHADITIDGITVADAGIHPRGVTSLSIAENMGTGRLPFKIKFDAFVDKQRFLGLDELALDNSACDPSYLRQYVGLEAYRALGMDVPYVAFFNVSVNGTPHGVYVGMEAIDSRFLERAFDSHKNSLYKADYFATLTPDMNMAALEQKKGADESKSDIAELIRVLDETPLGEKGEIDKYINVDDVLKIFAVDAVIHNWDGYAGEVAHNYYLYMSDGCFRMIPWDLNEAFLQTEAGERSGLGSREDIITPITGYTTETARPLVQKLMAVDEYYKQYISYCAEVNQWLEEFGSTRIPELHSLTVDYILSDPTRIYSTKSYNKQFDENNRDGLVGFIKERCEFLNARIPEILAEKGITFDE